MDEEGVSVKWQSRQRLVLPFSTYCESTAHVWLSFSTGLSPHRRSRYLTSTSASEAAGPPPPSRRRDCHLMAPPCTFIRCFNRDKQGVSST